MEGVDAARNMVLSSTHANHSTFALSSLTPSCLSFSAILRRGLPRPPHFKVLMITQLSPLSSLFIARFHVRLHHRLRLRRRCYRNWVRASLVRVLGTRANFDAHFDQGRRSAVVLLRVHRPGHCVRACCHPDVVEAGLDLPIDAVSTRESPSEVSAHAHVWIVTGGTQDGIATRENPQESVQRNVQMNA